MMKHWRMRGFSTAGIPVTFCCTSTSPKSYRALSHLYLAEVLDLRGNRQQAIANYQQVLNAPNLEDSHNTAEVYLKRPCRRRK
jgi:hypothetical protein